MHDLDDARDPNFADTDYQLAAYAAALRVLTAKANRGNRCRLRADADARPGEKSPVEELIERAVKIACDHLVPQRHRHAPLEIAHRAGAPLPQGPRAGEPRRAPQRRLSGAGPRLRRRGIHAAARQHEGQRNAAQDRQRVRPQRHRRPRRLRCDPRPPRAFRRLQNRRNRKPPRRHHLADDRSPRLRREPPAHPRNAEAASVLAGALRNRQDNV